MDWPLLGPVEGTLLILAALRSTRLILAPGNFTFASCPFSRIASCYIWIIWWKLTLRFLAYDWFQVASTMGLILSLFSGRRLGSCVLRGSCKLLDSSTSPIPRSHRLAKWWPASSLGWNVDLNFRSRRTRYPGRSSKKSWDCSSLCWGRNLEALHSSCSQCSRKSYCLER